jgi:hypothetical protein
MKRFIRFLDAACPWKSRQRADFRLGAKFRKERHDTD